MARLSAASTLSSTTRMRCGARLGASIGSASGRARRGLAGVGETRQPHHELAAPSRPVARRLRRCRRAARPASSRATGRCRARPARGRACARPGRTARTLRDSISGGRCRCRGRATVITASSPSRRDRRARCSPPSFWYLAALLRRFATTCVSRDGVAARPRSAARAARRASSCRCASIERRAASRPRAAIDRRRARPARAAAVILPLRDARDVEQVVDQARQLLDLALDHVVAPVELGIVARP